MSDLLIRNLDPELKRRLEEQARRDGRSLSEAAKLLLNRGLARRTPDRPLGTALVDLFRAAKTDGLEITRRERPRTPPSFE